MSCLRNSSPLRRILGTSRPLIKTRLCCDSDRTHSVRFSGIAALAGSSPRRPARHPPSRGPRLEPPPSGPRAQPAQPLQAGPASDPFGRRLRPAGRRTRFSRAQRHTAMRRHRVVGCPPARRQGRAILAQRHERPIRLEDACPLTLSTARLLSHERRFTKRRLQDISRPAQSGQWHDRVERTVQPANHPFRHRLARAVIARSRRKWSSMSRA